MSVTAKQFAVLGTTFTKFFSHPTCGFNAVYSMTFSNVYPLRKSDTSEKFDDEKGRTCKAISWNEMFQN
jgi:hypothetical protein